MGSGLTVVLLGCRGGPPAGPESFAGPVAVHAMPPVPDDIAAQRVLYTSPNLLPGDTSFELPTGQYIIEMRDQTPRGTSSVPTVIRARPVKVLTVHGHQVLRLSCPPSGREYVIRWPGVSLTPGKTHTFSAYARVSTPGPRVELACRGVGEASWVENFTPGDSWHRCKLSFAVPDQTGQADGYAVIPSIHVRSDGAGDGGEVSMGRWVEIDAVQLEAGDQPTPYHPQRPVDLAVVLSRRAQGKGVSPGEPLVLDCAIRNNSAVRVRLQLVWHLVDVLAGTGPMRVLQMELPPGRRGEVGLDFGSAVAGHYLLKTYVRGGMDTGFVDQCDLSVFERRVGRESGQPFFGVAEWSDRQTAKDRPSATSRLSVDSLTPDWSRRIRVDWKDVENVPGQDDWRRLDPQVQEAIRDGAEVVLCLVGPLLGPSVAPGSGSDAPPTRKTWEGSAPPWAVRHEGASRRVDLRQFRQFVFRIAARFAGRVRYWEVPACGSDEVVVLAKLIRQAVTSVDPRAMVLGPGIALPDDREGAERIESFLASGGGAEVDALLHALWVPDADHPGAEWGHLDRSLGRITQACAAAGRATLPRWEITSAWPPVPAADPAARASGIHRAALLLKKHGVARWLVPALPHDWNNGLGTPVEVTTLLTLARWFGPATFRREQSIGDGLLAMVFDSPDGPFAAIVCPRLQPASPAVTISVPMGVRVGNLFGRVLADGTWPATLTLTSTPVYLRPTDERGNLLEGVSIVPELSEDSGGPQSPR